MLIMVAGVWAFVAVASLYSIYLARSEPRWYRAAAVPADQMRATANRTDAALADLLSYASDVAAARRRRVLGIAASSGNEPGMKTLTLTELELNAFVGKWADALGNATRAGVGKYLSDGRVVLLDHRLLIAGKLKGMGILDNTVASVEFEPVIGTDGLLQPGLTQVYGGQLPIPWSLLGRWQSKLVVSLQGAISGLQMAANYSSDGLADRHAAEAAWGRLLLAGLERGGAEPIVMLPCDLDGFRRCVPVHVTDIEISDRTLSITLRPLTDGEYRTVITDALHQAAAGQ